MKRRTLKKRRQQAIRFWRIRYRQCYGNHRWLGQPDVYAMLDWDRHWHGEGER